MKGTKVVLLHVHTIGETIDHLCIDHCGVDYVDANPLRGKFQCSGFSFDAL